MARRKDGHKRGAWAATRLGIGEEGRCMRISCGKLAVYEVKRPSWQGARRLYCASCFEGWKASAGANALKAGEVVLS